MADGSPHNWTHRSDGQELINEAPLSLDCTDRSHDNYFGFIFTQRDDDDPLSSFMYVFYMHSYLVTLTSHTFSLLLPIRVQTHAGE